MKTKWPRWLFAVLVALLVVALALPGCAPEEVAPPAEKPAEKPAEEPAPVKDTLIIGVPDTAPGADCDIQSHPEAWHLIWNCYMRGLRERFEPCGEPGGPDTLKPVFGDMIPELFESWEISEDAKTITWHIRPGIKSYHGNEFTTEDVLWKFERSWALGGVDAYLMGVMRMDGLNGLNIIDKYTFSTTSMITTAMLFEVEGNSYFCYWDSTEAKKHVTEDDPWATEWIKRHGGCGLGRYVIDEWVAGDRIVLKANSNFYEMFGEPQFKTVILKVVAESASRVAMLEDGTIDIATGITPVQLDYLEGKPGVRVIDVESAKCLYIVMNNQMPPFDDVHVRRAINYAIPRDDVVGTAWHGYAEPFRSVIPSFYPGALTDEEFPYHYDLDKAREELAKSGYPEGFKEELVYDASCSPSEVAAVLLKESLAKIGIDVRLVKMPVGTITDKTMVKEMKFGFWQTEPIMTHPAYSVSLWYESISFVNYQDYRNPDIDHRITDAATILDFDESVEVHHNILLDIAEEAPMGWVIQTHHTVAMRDNIKGWSWITIETPDFGLIYTE